MLSEVREELLAEKVIDDEREQSVESKEGEVITLIEEDIEIETIAIDGICGVY